MDNIQVINEIKEFLDGSNHDLKYLVNVETNPNNKLATCVIHEPYKDVELKQIEYTPFLYVKDLKKNNIVLYNNHQQLQRSKMNEYGIKIKKLETGNQPRLEDGYCYLVTSDKSYNSIIEFFKNGGIDPYEKRKDPSGKIIKDKKGRAIFKNKDLFYATRTNEQFLISTGSRMFMGVDEYKDVHKLTYDIETTGLRYEICRMFAIGLRDNKGFETVLKVDKFDDDESEIKLIQDFFNTINYVKPAVINGYNSENFDFEFILGRANILNIDITKLITTLVPEQHIRRRPSTVKIGSTSEDYISTEMWGYNIIDIVHAAKKTVSLNTDMENAKLKYVCKYEEIAKPNRMYIDGDDGNISNYWKDNNIFIINPENNDYLEIITEHQEIAKKLYVLQHYRTTDRIDESRYKDEKTKLLKSDLNFVNWLRENGSKYGKYNFITGKEIVNQYLLDDLWETQQVDELYNQSTFLLSKIVPTTFSRIATMGTAAIWNLLMTTWSYENGLAIPHPDKQEKFPGGLARCFKRGYTRKLIKIDYASLYPMEQLTWDIFPIFDITGAIKKLLLYMTTTRNIYKKLANGDDLNQQEIELMKSIDHDTYHRYVNNLITDKDRASYKIKQLPIKILNNSLFGALGSAFAFNWSDNMCASRITCSGRLDLRYGISWFEQFDCIPLLAVTDGINFSIPETSKIIISDDNIDRNNTEEISIEMAWKYKGKTGISALIEKYNVEEMKSEFMSVDNDGEFISCLNLSRINYALLEEKKNKKTGGLKKKVKLTGNTIKSKTMPEYIKDFIDKGMMLILNGKGEEFVDYYYEYVEDIFYKNIPLKKIASKSKVKTTIKKYLKRGKDKNGREKGKQAHMELLIMNRDKQAKIIFDERFEEFVPQATKGVDEFTIEEIHRYVEKYMPPEPELDSLVYYINVGLRKSHGNSQYIKNPETGEDMYCAEMISNKDLKENPDLKGDYNVEKYLDAFNKRASKLLDGFKPEIAEKILMKIKTTKKTTPNGKKYEEKELIKNHFTNDDLILQSFELDTFDESMHLQPKEVVFWNRYGLNPNKVWNGFKTYDHDKIYLEIYEHALNYVSDQMESVGKPRVKRIDDEINKGDFVLLMDGDVNSQYTELLSRRYCIGYHNGEYIEYVKRNINIPKSNIELQLDEEKRKRIELENQKKAELNIIEDEAANVKDFDDTEIFKAFLIKFNLSSDLTKEGLFTEVPNAKQAYVDFKTEWEAEDDSVDYVDVDDGNY